MQFCHSGIVEELTATHCVCEVVPPRVSAVHIIKGGSGAPLGHYGVSLPKQ
jgi:hypothetical protein